MYFPDSSILLILFFLWYLQCYWSCVWSKVYSFKYFLKTIFYTAFDVVFCCSSYITNHSIWQFYKSCTILISTFYRNLHTWCSSHHLHYQDGVLSRTLSPQLKSHHFKVTSSAILLVSYLQPALWPCHNPIFLWS